MLKVRAAGGRTGARGGERGGGALFEGCMFTIDSPRRCLTPGVLAQACQGASHP